MLRRWAARLALIPLVTGAALGQTGGTHAKTGRDIFRTTCAACHGADGRGAPDALRGFEPPPTFPDFTACRPTAREPDPFWSAIIHNGGPDRGFSEIMPSFRETLTREEIQAVLEYAHSLCREPAWPRGNLNFPRALFTEKAFPEDEFVVDAAVNAEGDAGVTSRVVYEKRLGPRGQLDVSLPFQFQKPGLPVWQGGVGDLVTGYKRVVLGNNRTGTILSLGGEVIWATGDPKRGFGKGTTVLEGFASFGQRLPKESFVQFQSGLESPTHTQDANRAVFWRTVVGKSFAPDGGLGRLWSPMVELLADRELAGGERINWDVVPQFQVTLSRRQHVRAAFGVRLPVNDFGPRTTQLVFYVLWDWFDGGILNGWK